ncbi:GTPase [Actinoplanes sp. NPDC024001]|uniref:GTPase n=1 Tax=Actinoplanes sp. NPDC024001 TaxID=3154598 RepID=UPI0033D43BBA
MRSIFDLFTDSRPTTPASPPVRPAAGSLSEASRRAHERTRQFVATTHDRLRDTAASFRSEAEGTTSAAPLAEPLATAYRDWCARTAERLEVLLTQNVGGHREIRLALFGNSGAGKSTLAAAIGKGDGSGISPFGAMNHTRTVEAHNWEGCAITDLPGLDGRGGTTDVESLRETARTALVAADLALMCFVDVNQTENEFAQFAEWVIRYRKPAVAVLNVKSSMWRRPYESGCRSRWDRRGHSDDVAAQVERIRGELARLGLREVPVVAVQAQLAAFARCEPYRGQDAPTRQMLVEKYGIDQLLKWSNLLVLEKLLAAAIEERPEELRMAAFQQHVRTETAALAAGFDGLATQLAQQAAQVTGAVTKLLAITGAPHGDRPALTDLRQAAAQDVPAAAVGSAVTHARALIGAEFAALDRIGADNIDALVLDVTDGYRRLDEDTVQERLMQGLPVAATLERVGAAFAEHLRDHIGAIRVTLAEPARRAAAPAADGRGGLGKRALGTFGPVGVAVLLVTPLAPVALVAGIPAGFIGRWFHCRPARVARRFAGPAGRAAARGGRALPECGPVLRPSGRG